MDAYLGMALLAVFALVIGAVIFGGTTLAYAAEKHQPDAPDHAAEDRHQEELREHPQTREPVEASHRRAA